MTTKDKIDELKFVIERFDHYYDSVNNKGNLYLTLNTFILAGIVGGFASLNTTNHFSHWVAAVFLTPTLLFSLLSFLYTLRAITPFTGKLTTGSNAPSLLFFNDVCDQLNVNWSHRWSSLTEQEWFSDLQSQAQSLAKGLKCKFSRLRKASIFIGLQIIFILLFVIYFFII
jgi:hypothetical protein